MSRRKQSNPKPTKVPEDAMQPEQDSASDLKCLQNSLDSNCHSSKDNSDVDDDSHRLVIDTAQILLSSPSLTSDRAVGDNVDRLAEIPSVVFDRESEMVDPEYLEYDDTFCKDVAMEIVADDDDDLRRKSSPGSICSNLSDRDNASVSGSISNGEMPFNLSNSSANDATVLSDGSGAFKNSVSKSRKKSDLILPKHGNNGEENFACPICQEVLPTNHDFTCHIRSHNSPTNHSTINSCTICGKVLSSQSSLDRHMLVHSGERPFRCKVCDMAFTTNGNMHRHMRIHEKNFQAGNGVMLANGVVVKPRRKKKLLLEKRDLMSDPKPLAADRPAEPCSAPSDRNNGAPMERKRKCEISSGDGDLGKEQAKRVVMQGMEVARRLVLASRNLSMKRKKSIFRALPLATAFQRVPSINANESPMKCSECQQRFFGKQCLANDLEEHERRQGGSLSIFCIACEKMVSGARSFRDHLVSTHRQESETVSASVIAQNDLARLEFTSKNFPLVSKLYVEKQPRRSAGKDLPHFCAPCERSFMCEESLALHASEHAPNSSKTCATCGSCFKTLEHHQNHALTHESEVIVSGYANQSERKSEAVQDGISQQEFMLVLGMKVAENSEINPPEVTKDSSEVKPRSNIISNNLSLDDNQNLVKVLSLGEHPLTGLLERSSKVQAISPSNLLSILPKIPAKILAVQQNFDAARFASMARIPETVAGTHIDGNLSLVLNVESFPPRNPIDLNVASGEFILPRIEMMTDSENGNEDARSGVSGSSAKGSLPFKCSECSYSSTDKSTLLRHERKHNGQRPFQCRICDFAFTTKANCERHVRKKHPMGEGQKVEDAVGYTRFATESGSDASPSGSTLETVCKFCGEDFKFYRALKHHLRSQTSCQYKPCQCKICNLRFSTKANCWRHLVKKHHSDMIAPIESYMLVNSRSRSDDSLIVDGPAIANGDLGPHSIQLSSGVKVEVETALLEDEIGALNLRRSAPIVRYPALAIENEDSDEPLDFSLKSQKSSLLPNSSHFPSHSPQMAKPWSCDEPMDLTVKGQGRSIPAPPCESENTILQLKTTAVPFDLGSIAGKRDPKIEKPFAVRHVKCFSEPRKSVPFQFGSVDSSASSSSPSSSFSCAKCHLIFRREDELSSHMRTHRIGEISVFRCSCCTLALPNKAQLDLHMKTKHPQFTDVTSCSTSSSSSSSSHSSPSSSLLKEPNNNSLELSNANLFNNNNNNNNNNIIPMHFKPSSSQILNIACEADLASVPQILESTSGRQLKPILAIAKSCASVSVAAAATLERSNLECFANEIDISFVAAAAAAAVKSAVPVVIQKLDESDDSTKAESPTDASRTDSPEDKERNSTTDSCIVKKKRNSYADSPHKLHCSFCSRAFPWISSLKRHLLTHTGQKPYRCKHCTVTFSTKSNRERHMIRKHGLDVHDPATRQTMDRPFKCHLCVFSSFTTSGKLLRHYASKHPDREIPDILMQCTGSQSQDESDMASRSESADAGAEALKADQGNDLLDDDDDEDSDGREDETDDETKEVEQLTNSLIQDMNRKAGNIIVTSAEVSSVAQLLLAQGQTAKAAASVAAASVASASSDCLSDKHVNPERDNYNVDKITECWKCKKTFDCRKTLLRHLKEHSIDLPFKCYLCDASFDTRLTSLLHKREEHPGDWATVQDKNKVTDLANYADFMESVVRDTLDGKVTRKTHEGVELDIKPESDYAQRKVFCTLCPKRFWSLQDLRRHMRSHTGDRPFECDICFTRFTLKHSMMRHRRKHLNDSTSGGSGGGGTGTGAEAPCSASDDDSTGASATVADVGCQLKGISGDPSDDGNPTNSIGSTTEADLAAPSSSSTIQSKVDVDLEVKVSAAVKSSLSDQPDLLESLLGISDRSTIDRMLESPNNAATMLGLQHAKGDSPTATS